MTGRIRMVQRTAIVLVGMLLVAGLPGCGERDVELEAPATGTFPVTVTDDAGREVTIDARPERIVSLAPANTEIIAALGATDRLVGVTTLCDYPPEVADIEKMGDFVQPNLEAIAAAEPDLVLVTTGVQAEIIDKLEALGASVVAVDPQSLEEVYASIATVGAAIGEPGAAEDLVESMRLQIGQVSESVESAPVRCFIEIAQDPLFTAGAGTLLNELLEVAGGENVVTEEGYVAYSIEQLVQADPEVYLATKGSMSNPSDIEQRPGYANLAAVEAGRVAVLDDNLVSRPGPRLAEGVLQIARALHPEAFDE